MVSARPTGISIPQYTWCVYGSSTVIVVGRLTVLSYVDRSVLAQAVSSTDAQAAKAKVSRRVRTPSVHMIVGPFWRLIPRKPLFTSCPLRYRDPKAAASAAGHFLLLLAIVAGADPHQPVKRAGEVAVAGKTGMDRDGANRLFGRPQEPFRHLKLLFL